MEGEREGRRTNMGWSAKLQFIADIHCNDVARRWTIDNAGHPESRTGIDNGANHINVEKPCVVDFFFFFASGQKARNE